MKTCFDRESQILVESLYHAEIIKSLLVKNWPEAQVYGSVTRPSVSRHRLFVRHRLHTLAPGCSSQVAGIRLSCFPCKQVFSFRGSPSTILCSSLKRGDNNVLDSTSFAMALFPIALLPLHHLTSTLQGVPKKWIIEKILTKIECCGAKFPMNMIWERLILVNLSKKRPSNIFPDTGDASYWWSSLCNVVQAAFYWGTSCSYWLHPHIII